MSWILGIESGLDFEDRTKIVSTNFSLSEIRCTVVIIANFIPKSRYNLAVFTELYPREVNGTSLRKCQTLSIFVFLTEFRLVLRGI
jgi:hypothetical protein